MTASTTVQPVAQASYSGGQAVPMVGTPEYAAAQKMAADAAAAKPATPSLIVTSNPSRAEYSQNVNTLQSATSNLGTSNPSIVDYLNSNKMPSDYNSRAAMAKQYGIEGYTGSAAQNTQLLQILQNGGKTTGAGGTDTTKTDTTIAKTGDNGSGESTVNDAGETITTDASGQQLVNGIPKNLSDSYKQALVGLDEQINTAKSNLASALSTLQNNPAATAAVNMIMAKYDQQIQIMKDKNKILLGSYVVNSARSGMMQYANDMATNFMSEEQDRASQRVADLVTTEMSMVLKAQESYKKGDVAAFNVASKALEAATKQKTDAINKLLDASDKAIKTQQAEQKIQAAAAKQKITDDIRVSTSLGKTVADSITQSGITDQKKIDAYIDAMAEKSGISNPDILRSAVVKAQQDAGRLDLQNKNTISTINKRNTTPTKKSSTTGNGTDGSFKYTSDDVAQYSNFFNQGGQGPKGEKYNPRGTDGYVDPGAYTAAYEDWIQNGGTPQGFVKKFPVSNVNPESYAKLPKALQPKPKAGAAQPPL